MQPITLRIVGTSVIVVGTTEVTPAASHLFGLLLALSLSPSGAWTRRSLQDLLFGRAEERTGAHRLRQLLYRLRGFGLTLDEDASGVISVRNPVIDPLADAASPGTPGGSAAGILPLYLPRLPETFLDWLDEQRESLARRLATVRASALRAARERQEWPEVLRLALMLQAMDPHDEEWSQAAAESQAMLGRRDEALATIDRFVRESDADLAAWPSLKRLRARITTTRVPRREGTLRGREECLAFLADQWEMACAGGGGRLCVVEGPAGMGKTRVGEAVGARIELLAGRVSRFSCDQHTAAVPNALFAELVTHLRGLRGALGVDPHHSHVLDRLVSGAEAIPPEHFAEDTAARKRSELIRAIRDLIEAVSAEGPMTIVVDDAHLLDDASRVILLSLAATPSSARALFVILMRPGADAWAVSSSAARVSSYALPSLSERDSQLVITEISPALVDDAESVSWMLQQAAGNPFYLTTLALAAHTRGTIATHIASAARIAYFGISNTSRNVLEACIMLGRFANLPRVSKVADVASADLLAATRELSAAALLDCTSGLLRGPHDILHQAIADLIPAPVRAVLTSRIAKQLESELEEHGHAPILARAAISARLSLGETREASVLALRAARAVVGPQSCATGVSLLGMIPREMLHATDQRTLLDELIIFADGAGCARLLPSLIEARLTLATTIGEGEETRAALRLRLVECVLSYTGPSPDSRSSLEQIARQDGLSVALRAAACHRLLVWADLHLDSALAHEYMREIAMLCSVNQHSLTVCTQAQLVFHTVFGDRAEARALVEQILLAHPIPTAEPAARALRHHAAFALSRLGLYAEALSVASEDFSFFTGCGLLGPAQYVASLCADAELSRGNWEAVRAWLTKMESLAEQMTGGPSALPRAYFATAAQVAIRDMAHAGPAQALAFVSSADGAASLPRLRYVGVALTIRIQVLSGQPVDSTELNDLVQHYELASRMGAQDSTVLALWHAYRAKGDLDAASNVLAEYIATHRRELGPAEWILVQETAGDPAWQSAFHAI